MVVPLRAAGCVTSGQSNTRPRQRPGSMSTTSSLCRHAWILLIGIVVADTSQAVPVSASEYWVAPDGDDRLDGTTRQTAWASPSRGQPTRTSEAVPRGTLKLPVYSTEGFLDSGRLRIGQHVVAYVSRTERRLSWRDRGPRTSQSPPVFMTRTCWAASHLLPET
ncbi:MAG: hypothetical protein CM1200mP2_15340 [Planctomycetaceae bacterium]|nr:MAG: hypothetical protein CM1200mP2_15340 [Planctomycetaceae bacterium]